MLNSSGAFATRSHPWFKKLKMKITKLLILIVVIIVSCSEAQEKTSLSDTEQWKLGWRMIANSWNKDHQLAEKQFDSLLVLSDSIEYKFLITGLQTLHELGKREKLIAILNKRNVNEVQEICSSELFTQKLKDVKLCENIESEEVKNPDLQLELIKMCVDDQAARGNLMKDLIEKYDLNKDEITNEDGVAVDFKNRNRLNEIFQEYGFPTKEMVGKDAMTGIFMMIQHADRDKEWQKNQLIHIEKAVQRGDMNGQSYAYLYDRIKINSGEKQLYGTQFSTVDPTNKTVILAETENMDSLDYRRMEVGMMPIDMYKKFMLKNVSN